MKATISEREFQKMVLDLAKLHQWRRAHFRTAMTSKGRWMTPVAADGAGFPDLVLLRGKRLIVAELKVGKNKPTVDQLAWLEAFEIAGIRSFLWTPADWDEIENVLEFLR